MSKRIFAKNLGSMSAAVLISRVFGLVRDIFFARFFGATFVADAFNVAFQIPNLLRKLFGEGALSAAFIPIYSEFSVNKSRKEQIRFALNVLSLLTFFLFILSILGILLAPLIVRLFAPGFDVETYELTVRLTRILFPYLLLIGLSSTLISILNFHGYFFIPGVSSALLNIGMIGALFFSTFFENLSPGEEAVFLSVGVLSGGILQTVINFPLLAKVGYRIKLYFEIRGEALKNLWQRFVPGMIGLAIRDINLIADTILASFLISGSIAALQYGNRLMQLPLGIIGISAGSAVLPLFSRYSSEKKWDKLSETFRFGLASLTYIMIPVTFIFIALGRDIIILLFMRGAFDEFALSMTYRALLFYSLGLLFFSLNRTIIPLFYALKDTKTPVKISAVIVAVNIVLNIILMQFLQHAGLALASSIAALLHFCILMTAMKKKIPEITVKPLWVNTVKIFIMSLIVYLLIRLLSPLFSADGSIQIIAKLTVLMIISGVIYYLGTKILKVEYIDRIGKKIT